MTTQTEPRRLVRRSDDKVVAGVASGLAAYLGVDPVLVRVGFVLAATIGGVGVLAYIALWILTPEGEPGQGVDVEGRRDAGFWVAIGLFVLAALAIADNLADRNVIWPLILIAAGIALWRRSETSEPSMTTKTTPTPQSAEVTSPAEPGTQGTAPMSPPAVDAPAQTATPEADPSWTPPPPPESSFNSGPERGPRARRESSPLGGITIAVALIVSGIGLSLDQAGVIEYPAVIALSTAMAILAGGLVVGAWVGRARWLVFPALALTPFVLVFGISDSLDLHLGDGFGDREFTPASVQGIEDSYTLGVGELNVDLTEVDFEPGQTVTTSVTLGAGSMRVTVPEDVTVVVDYRMSAGDVRLFSGDVDEYVDQGTSLNGTVTSRAGAEGGPRLHLELDQTFGELEVVRR